MIKTDIRQLGRYLTPNVSKLAKHGVKSVESRVVNLSELAEITVGDLVPRIVEAFASLSGRRVEACDFAAISQNDAVIQRRAFYAGDEWRFGRWREFKATVDGSFAWGSVEVSLSMDGQSIADCDIATDALDTDAVARAARLLRGASIGNIAAVGDDNPIVADIVNLINSKI